ncbi:hypothetical protein WSM22_11430 [Cytophagales bacterium WSM2-2]|nr:hypothetical protein WSM22_11430 [Cytophagales bacterium WSM2-2]
MDTKRIQQTFPEIIAFIGIKPEQAFADVGASSGYYTLMIATLLHNVDIYIQDIDTACLNRREVDKVIDYYSRQTNSDQRVSNNIHLVTGTPVQTNLPDGAIDRIYTNATFHVLGNRDALFSDLRKKLRPGGRIVIRDGFAKRKGTPEFCTDKKCGKKLLPTDSLFAVMRRHGFVPDDSVANLKGYPAYRFRLKER